jgi:hypothetical protein
MQLQLLTAAYCTNVEYYEQYSLVNNFTYEVR